MLECITRLIGPARTQLAGRVLDDGRQNMLASWRQARITERGETDFDRWFLGSLTVLRMVEGTLYIDLIRGNVKARAELAFINAIDGRLSVQCMM